MTTTVTSQSEPSKRDGPVPMRLPAWGFLLGWLALFLALDPVHRAVCWFGLLPEQLIYEWAGGDWDRVFLLDRFPILGMALVVLLSAAAWGSLVLRLLPVTSVLSRSEHVLFSLATGLSCLSLLTLGVGCAGGLQGRVLFGCVVLIPILTEACCWKWAARDRAGDQELVGDAAARCPDPLSHRWLWLLAPLGLVIVLGAMLPPRDFDVREYHLQVPKEWYQSGRVDFLPHNVYGNMPLGAEILAIPAMALWPGEDGWWWGAMTGKTILSTFGLLSAWGIYLFGRRWFSGTAGLAGAVIFLATPWVIHVSTNGLVDVAVGYYGLMAVYAVFQFRQGPGQWAWAGLAGFLAGSAVACKYPALLMVVLPVLVYLVIQGIRFAPWAGLVFVVGVTLGCGPWFAKNYVMTENPVYPLMSGWLGGKTRTPERQLQWQRAHQVPVDGAGYRYRVGGLVDSLGKFAIGSHWQSPFLVPLAFLAVCWGKRRREVVWIAGMVVYSLLAWWLLTHRIERFWVPMLPLVALLTSLGSVLLCGSRAGVSLPIILVGATLFGTLAGASRTLGDNRFLVALAPLQQGPAREGEFEDSAHAHVHRYLNQHVSRSAGKVLLVGDAEPFDLEIPVLYNTCFDECILERLMRGRNAQQRLEALRQEAITHVFVYWRMIDRYRAPGNYGYTDYITRELVREELVGEGILRALPISMPPEEGELFEVSHRILEPMDETAREQEPPR